MIKLASDFEGFAPDKVSFAQILCLKSAFDGSVLEQDMWIQLNEDKITSVIAKNGGRLYICSDKPDVNELREFISVISPEEIFTEEGTSRLLRLDVIKSFSVMLLKRDAAAEKCRRDVPLKTIFEGLSLGSDVDVSLPPFEDFAVDFSHRLRHGAAVCVVRDFGAAIAFTYPSGAVINGISVAKDMRHKGQGSLLLKELLKQISGSVFACCSDKNKEFYIKNGFMEIDTAVIAR